MTRPRSSAYASEMPHDGAEPARTGDLPALADVPNLPRLPFDEWRAAVSDAFVPLEASSRAGRRFAGHLATASLGELEFAYVGGSAVTVSRTPAMIRKVDRGYLKVGIQARGYCVLTQDGRDAALAPGDVGVYDTTRPYTLEFERDFQMLVLMLPRELLSMRSRQLSELTARRISGRSGMGAVLSPFLSLLATRSLVQDVAPSVEVCDAVLDMLAATFRAPIDGIAPSATPASAHDALLLQIRNYIDEHLGDPALDLAHIADTHHISVRYLQKLFQADGTTVSAWIRQRRLQRCHRDLTDPRLRHVPVTAIGSRWGYSEPANFTRAFRAAYDEPPSALRARYA